MLKRNDSLTLTRKGFSFPMSVRDFSLKEDAKVASYEYAGRDGAEHERVLAYRVISVAGLFSSGSGDKTPAYYAQKLRTTNDNKPGTFYHPSFGGFTCIMKGLSISQSAEENEVTGNNEIVPNYTFSFELWETTSPKDLAKSKLGKLFSISEVKPTSNYYKKTGKATTAKELYNKVVSGEIPVGGTEWNSYPLAMRQEAYAMIDKGTSTSSTTVSNKNQANYTVKSGDNSIAIAKKFNIGYQVLFDANKGRKVRTQPKGTEGLYWKTASKLRPGDSLIIP